MPNAGDMYEVEIKQAHLEWGTHRYTNTRSHIHGEGYIQIPLSYARAYEIYNSRQIGANILYNCSSVDGFLNNVTLKASGNSGAGGIYAKQFQGNGNLRLIGDWYRHVNAQIGNIVRVTWTSPTDIILELL